MLVGQSPILTEHIEDQLRGLIIALFSTTGSRGWQRRSTGPWRSCSTEPAKLQARCAAVPTGGTQAAGLAIEMASGLEEQPGSQIGKCSSTSRTKPLTIIATASSPLKP